MIKRVSHQQQGFASRLYSFDYVCLNMQRILHSDIIYLGVMTELYAIHEFAMSLQCNELRRLLEASVIYVHSCQLLVEQNFSSTYQ